MLPSEIIVSIACCIAGVFLSLLGWGVIGGSFSSEEFKSRVHKRRWVWRIGGVLLIVWGVAGLLAKEILNG